MFDPGKCQLTIQIKRENLDEIQDKLASSESTAEFDSANRRLRGIENTTHQGRTREESSDIDSIQRQTLALVPTGTESAFPQLCIEDMLTFYGAVKDMATEDLDILGRLLQTNQKLCAMLEQRCGEITPSPGTSFQESFVFRDMLGREHVLEYKWFQHWEIFAAMLKCVFKDMPGEEYVELDKYFIFDSRSGGRPIDKGTWKQAIRPKSRIKMSIVISKQHLDNAQCRKCYEKCTKKCRSISTFTRW